MGNRLRPERLLVGVTIAVILYLYTNGIFLFFSPSELPELLRFFAIGAPFAILFFLFPRFALVILAFSSYFFDWLAFWVKIVPPSFTWFIDFILIIFLVRYFFLFPHLRARPAPAAEMWIWGLLLFSLFSALINETPTAVAFLGLRVSLKYLILFVVLSSIDLSEKFARRLLYLQFAIALVQIPIVLLEFQAAPTTTWDPWDRMGGTFGLNATGVLAVFLLGWIAFLIATMVEQRRLRLRLLLLILFLHIPPILGEGKAFFIVLIPLTLFMLRREWIRRPGLAVAIGLFSFTLFVGVDYVLVKTGYWISGRNPITYITNIGSVIERDLETSRPWASGTGEARAGRFFQAESGFRLATSSLQAFVFGFGPGAATRSFFAAQQSPTVAFFRKWGISSDAQSLAWMLVEYGVVGTLLFLVPPILLYRHARILRRSERESHRILAAAFQGLTFLYVINLFVTALLQSDQIGYFYWVTAAIVVQLAHTVKREMEVKDASQVALEPTTIAQNSSVAVDVRTRG
ncbi:MAG: hypothetical protein V1784_01350 [bacterium]